MASKGRKKKKDQSLIEGEAEEENGVTNPLMDENGEVSDVGQVQSGGESATEAVDEIVEAESLVKDLKTKHSQKQKELSKVVSPKDDLAGELRTIKRESKQKIEETERREEEEDAAATLEVSEDGTVPMPPDEEVEETTAVTFREEEPEAEESEESAVKKLKRKKEKVEEEEVMPLKAEPTEEAPPPPPPVEPTPPPPAEEDLKESAKTPRGASLKERMRNRLQKAKEEAVSEVRETEREERREKRLKRGKQRTRFDSEQLDEADLERMEEKTRMLREKLKKRQPLKDKGIFMPTTEEAYEFFTREWEPEPEPETKPAITEKAETEEKEKTEEEKKEEEEEKKEDEEEAGPSEEKKEEDEEGKAKGKKEDEIPLLDAIISEEADEEGYGLVAVRRAEYDDSPEIEKKLQEMLFVPSSSQIPSTEKVSEDVQPRFLEDEGFYVGTKPDIAGSNLNKMEHRILKLPDYMGREWFGEDGRLIFLPDPLRPTSSRPPVPEEQDPYLETVYRKAVMREYDNRYIDGSVDNSGFYQLDVDINSISFSHHHLYSREHVLAMRLTELYEQFLARRKKNMTEFLTEKLKALKSSALHLREHMLAHKSEHSFADRSNFEKRLQDYKFEIRQTRSLRDKEEGSDRTLLKNVIKTWKEIKAQRELQKYNNTNVLLEITREEVDKGRDQFLWKQEMEDELEEMQEEHEEEYNRKMMLYQEEMTKWKNQQEAKKEAMKRQKKRDSKTSQKSKQSRQSKISGEAAEQTEEEKKRDAEIINEEDYPQPDPPQKFDEATARQTIKDKVMEIRRRPGEPKLYPELTHTAHVTPTQSCPRGEQSRRDEISKCKIFIKIMFNQKEVSRTVAKPLTQDFKLSFGQIFNLKIVQWPESITFQIHEQRGFGSEMLAELCAGIPEASVTSLSVQLENLDFSSDHKVDHGHEGVGSGVPFSFGAKGTDRLTLMTTGELCCSVAWAVDETGQPLAPPSGASQENLFSAIKKMDPLSAIGAAGVVDYDKLSKWFQESRLDPNDPSNADLVFMLKPKGETAQLMVVDYFRLEQLQEEFNFVTDEELEVLKRFKLLQLRDTEVQEFRNLKMVPLNEREIPRDIFQEYEKKKKEEEKIKDTEKDIESHRAAVTKFMQRIREQVIRRFRMLAHQKRLEDMVHEEAVPNIAMIGTSLAKLLTKRRRPLMVARKERKKVTATVLKAEEVKILVNITRAKYVPIRTQSSSKSNEGDKKATKTIVGDTLVQPFVEVMFQHNSIRTTVGDGPNPSFNEELNLPFKAPNEDYSPSSLQTVTDDIFLNLFDEVIIDIQEDDRQRGSSVHQRIEKKWLGSLKIPFSTVYVNGKIEGTFQIKSPPVLLGYSYGNAEDDEITIGKDGKTFLTLFITIEPPLILGEPMKEKFSTNEDEKLLQYAETWQTNLSNKFPSRDYKTSVIDVNGKAVFITRYFKALKPPEELVAQAEGATSAERLARYVSLIPFVSDSVVFPGLCDIWSTCDQFLQMLAGDEEEHAVLLCNFFLSIGKKAWLVIGKAIPEGPTAYVMTEEGEDYFIWNAGTGDHFSYRDNYCPLQSVGCLINNENIWANIQQYEKPAQMNFNLSATSSWMPFFGSSFHFPGLGSVQPESLYYFKTDEGYVIELTEKIEQKLKDKIMEWRNRYITRWNRHCTQIMRKLLPILEERCGKPPDKEHLSQLENSFGSYKVSGFPINVPFTELNNLIETVYATGVHAQESSDVEFALAVYVKAYANSVLSVWIYVASLIRMR